MATVDLATGGQNYQQSGFINLPESIAEDYRKISTQYIKYDPYPPPNWGKGERYQADEATMTPDIFAYCRKYELAYGLGICIDTQESNQIFFITLLRGNEGQPFSDCETQLFEQLLHHVLQMWQFSLEDTLSSPLTRDIANIALARHTGYLYFAGPEFCELIYAQWPDWNGINLPSDLVAKFKKLPFLLRLPAGIIDITAKGENVRLARHLPSSVSPLSPRERRVAILYATGHSYLDIADMTSLSPATVRTYLHNAYRRLGVNNKVQLAEIIKITEGR